MAAKTIAACCDIVRACIPIDYGVSDADDGDGALQPQRGRPCELPVLGGAELLGNRAPPAVPWGSAKAR